MPTSQGSTMCRYLSVGQATGSLCAESANLLDPFELGQRLYAQATAGPCELPAQLLLLWCTADLPCLQDYDLLAKGVVQAAGAAAMRLGIETPPPLVGCSGRQTVHSHGTAKQQATLTVLRAQHEYLSAWVGIGEGALDDPQGAAREACRRADISAAALSRHDGFVLAILPGFRHVEAPSGGADGVLAGNFRDAEIYDAILSAANGHETSSFLVFGGASCGAADRAGAVQFAVDRAYTNSVVLTKVATRLNFGVGQAHGLRLDATKLSLGPHLAADTNEVETRVLDTIDGQPAGGFARDYARDHQRPCILAFTDPRGVSGPQRLFVNAEDPQSVVLQRPVRPASFARPASAATAEDLLAAVDQAERLASERGMLSAPKLALVVSCSGRLSLGATLPSGDYGDAEFQRLRRRFGSDTVVAGFYSAGEYCRIGSQNSYGENYTYNLLVLDDDLYPTIRIRQRLGMLDVIRKRLFKCELAARLCETAEDVYDTVGRMLWSDDVIGSDRWPYLGGMICRVAGNCLTGVVQRDGPWREIAAATALSLDAASEDILPLAWSQGQTQVITDSQVDPRCDPQRVSLKLRHGRPATVEGQVVLAVGRPSGGPAFGTLQFEIPRGYVPSAGEIGLLETFAAAIGASLEECEYRGPVADLWTADDLEAIKTGGDTCARLATIAEAVRARLDASYCAILCPGQPWGCIGAGEPPADIRRWVEQGAQAPHPEAGAQDQRLWFDVPPTDTPTVTLIVDGTDGKDPFSRPQKKHGQALAEMIASFVARADLRAAGQKTEEARTMLLRYVWHQVLSPISDARTSLLAAGRDSGGFTEAARAHISKAIGTIEATIDGYEDLRKCALVSTGVEPLDLTRIRLAGQIDHLTSANATPSCGPPEWKHDMARDAFVVSDLPILRIILKNLISNANKYKTPGSTARIEVRQDEDVTVVTVTNDGEGVPDQEKEAVFDPFRRLVAAGTVHGSGLGLYIARTLAVALQGSLVENGTFGQNARFVLTFPNTSEGGHDVPS